MSQANPSVLNFLHLADLQFERGELSSSKLTLLEYILEQSKSGFRPEFIFVTGDISRGGHAEEFDAANIFFTQLMEGLGIDYTRLYFVPGNHDLNLSATVNQSSLPANANPLQAYNHFVGTLLGRPSGFQIRSSPFFVQPLDWGELPITIIGLDSTMLGAVPTYSTQDTSLTAHVIHALAIASDSRLRFTLIHHGPEDLNGYEGGKALQLLVNETNFILHAHHHTGGRSNDNLVRLATNNRGAVIINSGSSFLIDRHPSIYSFVSFNTQSGLGTLYQKTFSEKTEQWEERQPVNFQGTIFPGPDALLLEVLDSGLVPVNEKPDPSASVLAEVAGGTLLQALEAEAEVLPKLGVADAWLHVQLLNGVSAFIQGSLVKLHQKEIPTKSEGSAVQPAVQKEPAGIRTARYDNDSALTGADSLGITDDVATFAAVFSAKQVEPPLCMGLFGDWGSGKSFFMRNLRDTVNALSSRARQAERDKQQSDFHTNIVQVEFNAWHYVDSNLWASMSTHIFTSLDRYLESRNEEVRRGELFKQLNAAEEVRAQAQRDVDVAEQSRIQAEQHLGEVRNKTISKEKVIAEVVKNLSHNKAVTDAKAELSATAKKMGLPDAVETLEDGRAKLVEMRTLGGRINTAFLWLSGGQGNDRWFRIGLLVLLLVIVPLLPAIVGYLLQVLSNSQLQLDALTAFITQITTFVAGLIAWLSSVFKKVSDGLGDLEEKQKLVDDAYQAARAQPNVEIQKLEKEMADLQKQEEAARQALIQAEQRILEAQVALKRAEKMDDARSLSAFIHDQAANQVIHGQLGLISIVRQNFENLTDLLEKGQEDDSLPKVDRIILYIDDLDRCPEEKVVEVLQAVHLLMAFKLFIVVVGVDSRWLLHSLEKAYPALQISTTQRFGWADDEGWAWESTPQNYLEKIFQLPYHLRPMDKKGFQRLITNLLPQKATESTSSPSLAIEKGGKEVETPNQPSAGNGALIPPGDTATVTLTDAISASTTETKSPAASLPLTADFLNLSDVEQEFIPHIAELIHTPRAAKRFVNIYRMIRAGIAPTEMEKFIGISDDPDSGQFRAVMLLLGILTGSPQQAPHYFRKLLNLDKDHSWKDAVALLKPRQVVGEGIQFGNGLFPRFSAADAVEWKRLYAVLNTIAGDKDIHLLDQVDPYQRWIPFVSRFSFRVGKIGENMDLSAKISITTVSVEPSVPEPGEFVEIYNSGDCAQAMTGWMLSDTAHHTFTFPPFELPAGCVVRVWTGAGNDTSTDLYWRRNASIWNDTGDRASLRDYAGSLMADFEVKPKK